MEGCYGMDNYTIECVDAEQLTCMLVGFQIQFRFRKQRRNIRGYLKQLDGGDSLGLLTKDFGGAIVMAY